MLIFVGRNSRNVYLVLQLYLLISIEVAQIKNLRLNRLEKLLRDQKTFLKLELNLVELQWILVIKKK